MRPNDSAKPPRRGGSSTARPQLVTYIYAPTLKCDLPVTYQCMLAVATSLAPEMNTLATGQSSLTVLQLFREHPVLQ